MHKIFQKLLYDIQYWDLKVEQELFRQLQRNLDKFKKKCIRVNLITFRMVSVLLRSVEN